MAQRLRGVLAPVVTPFNRDLAPDTQRFVRHCKWLLAHGCSGLAVFGTNSEANSLSAEERMMLLEELVQAGVPPEKLMPGTGCSALTDSVRLTAHAVKLGCAGALMLPPFYYKGVSDEGLFRAYSEVIQRVGDARLRIYLYHFPQLSGVPITLSLIERLLAEYPDQVVGIKDSSGDWGNMEAMLTRFPGFAMFAGTEAVLLKTMKAGGAGCISATANINPAAIADLAANWQAPGAEAKQEDMNKLRTIFQARPLIPAMKAAVAHFSGDAEWERVRPPLVELSAAEKAGLLGELEKLGFEMPGLSETRAA